MRFCPAGDVVALSFRSDVCCSPASILASLQIRFPASGTHCHGTVALRYGHAFSGMVSVPSAIGSNVLLRTTRLKVATVPGSTGPGLDVLTLTTGESFTVKVTAPSLFDRSGSAVELVSE